jgi:hypothetical protein
LADQANGILVPVDLIGEDAQEMQGVGISWVDSEYLPITGLRFPEFTGAVPLQGLIE